MLDRRCIKCYTNVSSLLGEVRFAARLKIEKKYNEHQSEDNKFNKQNKILLSKLNDNNLNFDDFHLLWMLLSVFPLQFFGQFVSHVTVSSARWASLGIHAHRHRS